MDPLSRYSPTLSNSIQNFSFLHHSIWDISWEQNRICVNGASFKLNKNPLECRRAYLEFLNQMGIPRIFHFQLEDRECKPDSYDANPICPMPFDLIPLLEYRRTLLSKGESAHGSEALINWLVHRYLPNEPIQFAMYARGKKIGTEWLSLDDLMRIYDFVPGVAKDCAVYDTFPPNSTVYIPLEPSEASGIHSPRRAWEENPQILIEIQQLEPSFLELFAQWEKKPTPDCVDQIASLVTLANEILPECPLEKEFSFTQILCRANEIIEESFRVQQDRKEPPLSPESDRRHRRAEKEKAE